MRKLLLAAALAFTTSLGIAADSTAKVDTAKSKVSWVGKKVTGQHNGTIKIKEGKLTHANSAVTGGEIVIDMPSITVLDIKDPETNAKLTGHLKSDDFFGVEKNPAATFKITKVEPIANAAAGAANQTVTGDLTIKGNTHSLSFPATIKVAKGSVSATAKDVKVDRTLYDVRYGSGKFFENLGDKTIYDEFLISFDLTAK